jgi:hypothetical protein
MPWGLQALGEKLRLTFADSELVRADLEEVMRELEGVDAAKQESQSISRVRSTSLSFCRLVSC